MASPSIFKTTKHNRPPSSKSSLRTVTSTNHSLIIPALTNRSDLENISPKNTDRQTENYSYQNQESSRSEKSVHFKIDLSTKNLSEKSQSVNRFGNNHHHQNNREIEISERPSTNTGSDEVDISIATGSSSQPPKSIDTLLSQREQINKKIERRRKEKQRLARIKAIEDLKKAKDLEKINNDKREQDLADNLSKKLIKAQKQQLTSQVPSNSKVKIKPKKVKSNCPTPSTATSITEVSNAQDTSRSAVSVLSHGKSETLDAILDSLRDIEESTKNQIERFKSHDYPQQQIGPSFEHVNSVTNTQNTINSISHQPTQNQVSSKINSIMSYLDDIEKNTKVITPRAYGDNNISSARSSSDIKNGNHPINTAESTVQQITNSVLSQKLHLDEAKEAIKILEHSLQKQKELSVHQLRQTEADLSSRIKVQKEHYESTITRHLAFIDQLITDKKKLQEKYEDLAEKSKNSNESLATALDKQKKQHNEAVNLLKENYLKAERDRREKWIEEQTKIIKKSTVNALEPEINKLMAAHKQEINRLKTLHEADIIEADERASKKYVEQINKLRKDLESDRDEAVDRERMNAQARFDKMLQQEEVAFHAQKKRLYQEIAEEKERLFHQSNRLKKENEEFKKQLESTQSSAVKALTAEFETAKLLSEKRHKKEIEHLKTDFQHEKERQKSSFEKEFEIKVASMQKVIMEGSREARDKEIKLIVDRLESEHNESRSVDSQAVENRIRRVREKYESELREVERSERLTQNRYVEVKQNLVSQTEKNLELDRKNKQVADELENIQSKLNRLISEKDQVRDIIRDEFSDRLVLLEDENCRYKREFSELRARHKLEVDNCKSEKECELKAVHERVKSAIARKEESVGAIKRQLVMAEKRSKHLEELLEEQRKIILKG